jgi:hypothetical protein
MREGVARILEQRLLGLHIAAWIEDLNWGGRRLDPPKTNTYAQDEHKPMRVCLDDPVIPQSKWYAVYPANTPNGPRWFLRCSPPGLEQQILWDESPISVVERAAAIRTNTGGSMLDFAEKAISPEPKPESPVSNRR